MSQHRHMFIILLILVIDRIHCENSTATTINARNSTTSVAFITSPTTTSLINGQPQLLQNPNQPPGQATHHQHQPGSNGDTAKSPIVFGTKGNVNYGTSSVSTTTGFSSSSTAAMSAMSTPAESNYGTTVGLPSSASSGEVDLKSGFTPAAAQPTSIQEYGDPNQGESDEHILIGSGGPDQRESTAIQKALDWLREKRDHDYGWNNDTHMVILAKELSGGRDPVEADNHVQMISDLEDLLSVKQMEIEIMTMLDRHHSLPKPVNADKLARYVLALGVLCKDPKRFHNHDLVAALLHHEPTQDQEFALVTLAACSSAAHVRKRHIRRLLDIASGGSEQSVDTMAMVLLALRCIITDHRHRHLQHFVRRPARGLASLQGPRGSFGSLRSTALAMQALLDLELDPSGKWNRSAASKWILDRQRADGAWTEEPLQDGQEPDIGIGLTADIILALGWRGLGAVRVLQCDHVIREMTDNPSENGEPKLAYPVGLTSSVEQSEGNNISYTYTLWVGTNVTEAFSLSLVSPKNTSFFRAMTQAAEIDPRFTFEAREWPNGHYVHTLAGMKEEPRGYNYWLLYRLPELPDPNNPPGNQLIAPVGVDELMVEDGEHYLYWYKKL